MRRTKEGLLSLLLALALAAGLLPGTARAAGEAPTAYVTISAGGKLETAQLAVSLTDQDEDGALTVNDALLAAHNAAYSAGAASGYGYDTGNYGLSMSKLWGDDSGSFGYWKNDSSCWSLADPVSDGDYITAFVYRDKQFYSDMYSYFDIRQKTAVVGGDVPLTLYRVAYDENYDPVPTAVSEAAVTVNGTESSKKTDEHGQVTLTFDAPGTYVVSADKTISTTAYDYTGGGTVPVDAALVPPVCTVTVLSQEDYADYETRLVLEQAMSALTWDSIKGSNTYSDAVTGDLSIPSELAIEHQTVALSWSCDDTAGALSVSNYYGSWGAYVDRPAARDVSCALTATLSYGGETSVKTFPITVKAEGVNEAKETVVTYGDLLSGIASGYAVSADPWVVLEMAAYNGANVKDANGYGYSSVSTALADAAIGEEVTADTLNGVDISGSYAIYTIPYLSLAYQAAGISNEGRMAEMKTAMADYLNNLESSRAGTDEATPVLAALAPYYRQGDSGLDAAVDAAVAWLSGQQNSDGTFSYYGTPNANSTALAVVALSALDIDAHTDSRFLKNDKSAMDGLFSFALADHSGFGYKGNVTKNALATEQGFRALVSYARLKESGAAYNIYLQAKDREKTVAAPGIAPTTRPSGDGGSGSESASFRISVSVMAPPEGGADGQYTYRHDSSRYTNLLGSVKQVSVDRGTTALAALTSVLDDADIAYTASASGYVSEIGGLAELDHGPNSGWQYMVDGTAPGESASTYTFSGNGKMVWYYTDDYTREKSADSWSGKTGTALPEDARVTENKDGTYTVTLPGNSDGPALVVIPEVGEGQLAVIVGKDGSRKAVKKSLVRDGMACLLLKEDAIIQVVDYASAFDDVASGDWYASAVDFVTGRGLFSGVTENAFAPNMPLNRGMLVTVLYALEEPGTRTIQKQFYDVDDRVWYAQGVAWAVDAGIASGCGNGLFCPEEPITREQLALMLYQYAGTLGLDTSSQSSLERFRDSREVSSWASDAVSWAVHAGLLSGRPDGTLDPNGAATRAEAAAMTRQLVALMMK